MSCSYCGDFGICGYCPRGRALIDVDADRVDAALNNWKESMYNPAPFHPAWND